MANANHNVLFPFTAPAKEPVKAPGLESDDIWGDAPDVSIAIFSLEFSHSLLELSKEALNQGNLSTENLTCCFIVF